MPRRSTDLLDIFRRPDEPEQGAQRSGRTPARRETTPAKAKAPRPARSDGPGLTLTRRQVVLSASAVGLLVVLGFTLGLATGRSHGRTDASLARAERAAPQVFLQGRIDAMDPQTLRPVDPTAVLKELVSRYGLPAAHVDVRREDSDVVIEIGPFASRERAEAYAKANKLDLITLFLSAPFRWPSYPQR